METRDDFIVRLNAAVRWINKYKKKQLAYGARFNRARHVSVVRLIAETIRSCMQWPSSQHMPAAYEVLSSSPRLETPCVLTARVFVQSHRR